MLWKSRRHWSAWLLSVFMLLGLVLLPPTPALAETSYHKLKKRLRKAERTSGQVLQVVGAVMVYSLCEGTLAILNSALNDNDASDAPQPGKAKSESVNQATKTKAEVHHSQPAKKE